MSKFIEQADFQGNFTGATDRDGRSLAVDCSFRCGFRRDQEPRVDRSAVARRGGGASPC